MNDLRKVELAILSGTSHPFFTDVPSTVPLASSFLEGNFEDVLRHPIGQKILTAEKGPENLLSDIKANVDHFLSEKDRDVQSLQLDVLIVGASCLQLFVQNNWVGPFSDNPPQTFLGKQFKEDEQILESWVTKELEVDGSSLYTLARFVPYLYIARCIFHECQDRLKQLQTADWWLLRCAVVHQEILDEKSHTLKETSLHLITDISNREPLLTDDSCRDVSMMFHLEAGHVCHTYFEIKLAREHFDTAKKISGLEVKLTGAMGKRTRFQQDEKAQLILQVTREETRAVGESSLQVVCHSLTLPKIVALDDDTVLDVVQFSGDNQDLELSVSLSPVEQAVVLGVMESYRRSVAAERLTEEEIMAYICTILPHVTNWCTSIMALVLRSKFQKTRCRTVERSMSQIEELVNQMYRPSPSPSQRLSLFYATNVPTIWNLQRELASLLLSLGAIGSALDIFERLEMWEQVIECYQTLQKLEKAKAVIEEQLKVKETPILYCFLGDVTKDMKCYQKAWELSNHHSARAMRCMAYIHFTNKQYDDALECFQKSLSINPLQIPVWFTYGCTAMAAEKFEIAVKAFKRCVNIDFDNYEAWANLATSYVKLKDLPKAFAVLKESIKCNYDNWRLWENCLIIGADCGEFNEVIRAYHRLMDIKDKWTDLEVLNILVRAVTENIPDTNGTPAGKLRPALMELFGRITSKITSEARIWQMYAELNSSGSTRDKITSEKTLQYLQKAHRCDMQKSDWEKNIDKCKEVAALSAQLAKAYQQCAELTDDHTQCLQMMSSAKLMLKGITTKIKQQHLDPTNETVPEDLERLCGELESQLQVVVSKIEHIKGS
ncbi:tetratricopeptide repeat protein 27-like [Gigantopelta aegis]|uniref:tetratricopeptide repeat protein 27-like n=1 Tax=Gigantopelta aegis TaxID=1735272 RepID=UPI001B88B647|nr:tetratricopeptide repeat protein 27-like [Gigantopelta aegis]